MRYYKINFAAVARYKIRLPLARNSAVKGKIIKRSNEAFIRVGVNCFAIVSMATDDLSSLINDLQAILQLADGAFSAGTNDTSRMCCAFEKSAVAAA
jgi:hypothetical protein